MGRTLPTECEHGTVIDWGGFGPEDGPEPVCGACLRPGQKLQHGRGKVVTLDRRKTPEESHLPGWWLREGGGLCDQAIESGDWTVLDGVHPDECPTCGQPWPADSGSFQNDVSIEVDVADVDEK